jgi:lipopolysaccharide transport system ATP-binding protein
MRKWEIRKRFDEIVAFSGVERYIDTPVKRYSSGMYVRLAFAVAAHLESEILIVDEVLAVGDAEFQKKCLGKMNEVSRGEGRTVLFVSHNMRSVQALCTRGLVLTAGSVSSDGMIDYAIRDYLSLAGMHRPRAFNGKGLVKKIEIISEKNQVQFDQPLAVRVSFDAGRSIRSLVVGINIKDHLDNILICINNRHYHNGRINKEDIQAGVVEISIKQLSLLPGTYSMDVFLGDTNVDIEELYDVLSFDVAETPINPTTHPINPGLNRVFMKDVSWKVLSSAGNNDVVSECP